MKTIRCFIAVFSISLLSSCTKFSNEKIYSISQVDKIPEYPGGLNAFYEYLNEELSNPSPNDSIHLLYRIEIYRHGVINNISVLNGYNLDFDQRVKHVIVNSKKWSPGLKENIEVPVFLDLPFLFLPSE